MTPNGGVWHPGIYDDLTKPHQPYRSHLMGFIARQRLETTTFTDAIALEALERVLPPALIQACAADAAVPTERRRKLPSDVTLLLCIAMSLWTAQALDVVLH